jgi:hypothetical protein
LRSGAFAVAAVGLAVGAHVSAGGALPAAPLIVGLAALIEAVVSTTGRRRRGPTAVAAGLLVTQALLHVVFAATESSHAGHAAHSEHLAGAASPAMLTAHALAAVVLGSSLSHGERLVEWAVGLLLPIVVIAPFRRPAATEVPQVPPVAAAPGRWVVGRHDRSRRGPPAGSCAVRPA